MDDFVQATKSAVVPITDDWRQNVNKKISRISICSGMSYSTLYPKLYRELELRAGCNLSNRLRRLQTRMTNQGATKSEVDKCNRLQIVASDKKLKEIFGKVLSEYEIKYCA